jgi:predicted CoA-binding protein
MEKLEAEARANPASGHTSSTAVDSVDLIQKAVTATIDEMEDIRRRERNIVIFGIPEDPNAGPDYETNRVKDILRAVGIADQCCIVDCRRLGRVGGDRPRVLRVRLSSVELKHDILRVARTLKDKGYASIYIKPDLTKRQLAEQRELVDRMKAANATTRTVRIHRGRLVPLDFVAPGQVRQ